jgi:hypothetical protein
MNQDEQPLNPFFQENGFSSKVLIKNLGSTFVYIIILLAILLSLPILYLLGKYFNIISKFHIWLRDRLIWGGIISFLMSQFPPIIISCCINLYALEFSLKQKPAKIASSVLSLVLLTASLATLPIVWAIIRKRNSKETDKEEFKKKFRPLI